jgi:hypothetical protein
MVGIWRNAKNVERGWRSTPKLPRLTFSLQCCRPVSIAAVSNNLPRSLSKKIRLTSIEIAAGSGAGKFGFGSWAHLASREGNAA